MALVDMGKTLSKLKQITRVNRINLQPDDQIEQVLNAYPGRRICGIDTSEQSGDIIFVFTCVFLMAVFSKYLRNFFLTGLDPTTYTTKSVFSRGLYWYQIS